MERIRIFRLAVVLLAVPIDAAPAQISPIGLSEVGGQWFENLTPEPPWGTFGPGDDFGQALATGDFNGDGSDDLAVGSPGDDDPPFCPGFDCGTVLVRYGVAGASLGPATTLLRQDAESNDSLDRFGAALTAGDFDGDGYDDLAVGAPGHYADFRGAVLLYSGSASGLAGSPLLLGEADAGEPDHICNGAGFGSVLVAGNFDHDAYDDLAIGVPNGCERVEGVLIHSGAVFVAHGRADGLLPFFGYRISQNSLFLFEECEAGDRFGFALAPGDFDHDTYDDLAIGIPGEDDHGAMDVIFGSQNGLIYEDSVFWYPEALGEESETGDLLGYSLAAGRFDDDPYEDLAIGAPYEDLGVVSQNNAGAVTVAYGSAASFDLARTDHLIQSGFAGGEDEESDFFGFALAAGDFDGDGLDDLAVSHPSEKNESDVALGAVTVIAGAPSGLGDSIRFRFLVPGREGVPGDAAEPGGFGRALASGDFGGDGFDDLAIGIPLRALGDVWEAGAVATLQGALFADGFEVEGPGRWSSSVPEP